MQHINLYHQLERVVEPLFSARQQLLVLVVVAVVMVLIFMGLLLSQGGVDDRLAAVQHSQKMAADQLNQLTVRKSALLQDKSLMNEIEVLEQELIFRRQLLSRLDQSNTTASGGFAEHLQGLARRHIDGLWFTEIQLQHGGEQLVLKGQTRQPEFLPRYLQILSAEPAFQGQQFGVLRMSLPKEHSGLMDFELRSKALDVADE